MYLEHFGLEQHPFSLTPDDTFLYLSPQHSKALVFMEYAASNAEGIVVITGEIGAGKTTIVKRLMSNFKSKIKYFHLSFTNLSSTELLEYLLKQIGGKSKSTSKVDLIFALREYLNKKTKGGLPYLLIVDEAQNISEENLENIRLLAGLEGENGPLLSVVLVGQPEFLDRIRSIEQLQQRVKLHFHLSSLGLIGTEKYIEFRLIKAGLESNTLFNATLIERIHRKTGGTPRLINKLCDGLLMCAFADGNELPSESDIDEIVQDLMMDDFKKVQVDNNEAKGKANANSDHDAIVKQLRILNQSVLALVKKLK